MHHHQNPLQHQSQSRRPCQLAPPVVHGKNNTLGQFWTNLKKHSPRQIFKIIFRLTKTDWLRAASYEYHFENHCKYPTSCSEGGHEGLAGSECYITCPPTYEIVWDEAGVPETRSRSLITCKDNGVWKAMGDQSSFTCQNPCPEMTKLKSKFVVTKNKWPTGTSPYMSPLQTENIRSIC